MKAIFDRDNGPSKHSKIIKFHWFYSIREILAVFKLRSIWDAILVPTWFNFGGILDVLGGSGRLLGPLGGVLGPSWGVLAAPWRVLGRLDTSWERLGGVLGPQPPSKKTCH